MPRKRNFLGEIVGEDFNQITIAVLIQLRAVCKLQLLVAFGRFQVFQCELEMESCGKN
jgi:hypothetical protein